MCVCVCLLFRCGLAFTISTNLVVWMAAVTEESVHSICQLLLQDVLEVFKCNSDQLYFRKDLAFNRVVQPAVLRHLQEGLLLPVPLQH